MKKISIQYIILFLFLLVAEKTNAQNDVITTTKGEKIMCTITKENDVNVFFKVGGDLSSTEAFIAREDIKSIEYAPKQKQQPAVPIINPEQIETDEYVAPPTETATIHSPTINIPLASNKPMNIFSFLIGYSLPVAKFAEKNLDTNAIGPAINGQVVQLGYTHLVNKWLGGSLQCFYSQNDLNAVPIVNKYQQQTDSVWHSEKSTWRSFGINVGATFYKEINDFLFFAKATGGFLSLKYPELKLSVSSSNYIQYQTVSSDAISFGGALGVNYAILENLNISLEASYLSAKCKYSELLILGEQPGNPFPKKTSITKRNVVQNYQMLFATLGLSYRF